MLRRLPPLLAVPLVGCSEYAVENLLQEDLFRQARQPPADVLFVVDDSASMTEEQARLTENFAAFVDLLGDTTADFRVGVTTTDPADGGALRGPVLEPDTDDLVAAFQAQVAVGTGGSRDEQGLAMAARALRPDVNAGFLREDAVTHVVFVSDEDDHSDGEPAGYVEALQAAAGVEGIAAHALVGDEPEGCLSGSSAADAGTRYLAVARELGGLTESLCADDYGGVLEAIGLAVSGWNPSFPLSALPAEASITVWVDGVEIPEREIDGWTWSIGDNAIVFSGRAIPRPGMSVRVTYQRGA